MRGGAGGGGGGGGKGKEMGGQRVSGGQVCIAKEGKRCRGRKASPPYLFTRHVFQAGCL